MSEYTPTTDEIREYVAYGDWGTEEHPVEEFDRWLAKHDAEVERAVSQVAYDEGAKDHADLTGVGLLDRLCNPYRREEA